jgi:hypothetical protein
MLKYLILLISLLVSSIQANPGKIIQREWVSWETQVRDNEYVSCGCYLSFDSNNGNFKYDCKGLELTTITVKDSNGFVIGSAYVGDYYNNGTGYGTIKKLNGEVHYLGGRGTASTYCREPKGCIYGYRKDLSTDRCVDKPEHSTWASDTYNIFKCNEGFEKVGNKCEFKHKIPLPENAYWDNNYSDSWSCYSGYEVPSYIYACKKYKHKVKLIANAHWANDYNDVMHCNDRYYKEQGQCLFRFEDPI